MSKKIPTIMPGALLPFHWPRTDLDQLLCIRSSLCGARARASPLQTWYILCSTSCSIKFLKNDKKEAKSLETMQDILVVLVGSSTVIL